LSIKSSNQFVLHTIVTYILHVKKMLIIYNNAALNRR